MEKAREVATSEAANASVSGAPSGEKGGTPNWSAWQFAWELGFTIAIPIVALAFLGRLADKRFDTSPWLLLAGVTASVFISSFIVYRKVAKVIK